MLLLLLLLCHARRTAVYREGGLLGQAWMHSASGGVPQGGGCRVSPPRNPLCAAPWAGYGQAGRRGSASRGREAAEGTAKGAPWAAAEGLLGQDMGRLLRNLGLSCSARGCLPGVHCMCVVLLPPLRTLLWVASALS